MAAKIAAGLALLLALSGWLLYRQIQASGELKAQIEQRDAWLLESARQVGVLSAEIAARDKAITELEAPRKMTLPTKPNVFAPWYARSTGSPKSGPGPKRRCRLLLLPLLPLALMSCTSQPVPPRTQVVVIEPPVVMMMDCQRPSVDLSTNATVIDSLLAAHARIVECNIDRKAAREYVEAAKSRLDR